MSGIFLLFIVGLWVWLVFKASKWIGAQVRATQWRTALTGLVFVLLLGLPFADEIIGRFEFRKLCRERAVLQVDAERIRYKTIRSISKQTFPSLSPLAIEQWTTNYVDVSTGEKMAYITWLRAKGGWISRNFTEGRVPITFQNATCSPPLADRIEKLYTFTLIDN